MRLYSVARFSRSRPTLLPRSYLLTTFAPLFDIVWHGTHPPYCIRGYWVRSRPCRWFLKSLTPLPFPYHESYYLSCGDCITNSAFINYPVLLMILLAPPFLGRYAAYYPYCLFHFRITFALHALMWVFCVGEHPPLSKTYTHWCFLSDIAPKYVILIKLLFFI